MALWLKCCYMFVGDSESYVRNKVQIVINTVSVGCMSCYLFHQKSLISILLSIVVDSHDHKRQVDEQIWRNCFTYAHNIVKILLSIAKTSIQVFAFMFGDTLVTLYSNLYVALSITFDGQLPTTVFISFSYLIYVHPTNGIDTRIAFRNNRINDCFRQLIGSKIVIIDICIVFGRCFFV